MTEINVDSGDISVGSASGKLKAVTRNGNIDVNLSHHDDVTLRSKEGKYMYSWFVFLPKRLMLVLQFTLIFSNQIDWQ